MMILYQVNSKLKMTGCQIIMLGIPSLCSISHWASITCQDQKMNSYRFHYLKILNKINEQTLFLRHPSYLDIKLDNCCENYTWMKFSIILALEVWSNNLALVEVFFFSFAYNLSICAGSLVNNLLNHQMSRLIVE